MIITEKVVKHPDRAEADRFFNYPYAAIEEALANAVYHKAYDEREPIEVRVNHNMIEIISHPGPDRSVTIQGLKEFRVYSRRYRNRRIGEFLKDLHLTEGRKAIKDAIEGTNKNITPGKWREELKKIDGSIGEIDKQFNAVCCELARVEVLEHNKKELKLILEDETHKFKHIEHSREIR